MNTEGMEDGTVSVLLIHSACSVSLDETPRKITTVEELALFV